MSVLNFANRAVSTSSGRFSGFKIANKWRSCLFTSTLLLLIWSQCMLGGNAGYLRIRWRFVTELHLSSSHLFFSSLLALAWTCFFLYSGCWFFKFFFQQFHFMGRKGKTKTRRERSAYFPSLRSSFMRGQKEQCGLAQNSQHTNLSPTKCHPNKAHWHFY